MKLIINGNEKQLNTANLQGAIEAILKDSSRVIAELNGEIVKKPNWPSTTLKDGDKLELVSFVGGG